MADQTTFFTALRLLPILPPWSNPSDTAAAGSLSASDGAVQPWQQSCIVPVSFKLCHPAPATQLLQGGWQLVMVLSNPSDAFTIRLRKSLHAPWPLEEVKISRILRATHCPNCYPH